MRLRRLRLVVVAIIAALFTLSALSWTQEKRPVSFEDLLMMKGVGAPQISPDGSQVIFAVSGWEKNDEDGSMESVSHVYRVSTEGGDAVALTRSRGKGNKGETAPRWSPDGQWVSFLRARDGDSKTAEGPKRQIWLMLAKGGEAFALTEAKEDVVDYAWSPDSRTVAFVTRDGLSDDDEQKKKRRDDAAVYEGDSRMHHLWVIDVETKEARRQTSGTDFTVKGRPSWSPDGTRIAFTAAPTLWLRDSRDDVYVLTVGGDIFRITTNPGSDRSPAWSPDGRWIAFLSTPNDAEPLPDGTLVQPLVNAKLMLYDVARGAARDVAGTFDRIPTSPYWTPDGRSVLFVAGDSVYRELFAFDVEKKQYRKLTREKLVNFGSLAKDGSHAVFTLQSASAPADVYVSGADFSAPRKLTDMHPEVHELALGATRRIVWKSTDGLEVEGLLLLPVGYEQGKRYPLMVVAHGGPTGAHLDYFRVRYGDGGQHWAGKGWAVLYPNPRGSTNYGEAFMRGNLADWGGGDYRDIMAGVDAVIERGIADPDRLAFQGWSYGGYMTCWTISQTTRFKAAMIGAGLTDLVSMYGTNDIPSYLGTFFNGTLSAETEHLYRERSGLSYVDRVQTPTLILHGGNDHRVPIGQPMELYRALKDRGVPRELVFYPREGHGLREYYHRLDRLKRQYEWITRYTLKTDPTTNEKQKKGPGTFF